MERIDMLRTAHISAMVNDPQRTIDLGFSVDEPVTELGEKLMLPSWLESKREELEKT
jgi:hypothetical protein